MGRLRSSFRILLLAVAAAGGSMGSGGCIPWERPDPAVQLSARVPGLSADAARHLVADDDSTFARWCREQLGADELLQDICLPLLRALDGAPAPAHAGTFDSVGPYMLRAYEHLAREFGFTGALQRFRAWSELAPEQRYEVSRLRHRLRTLFEDYHLEIHRKINALVALIPLYRAYPKCLSLSGIWLELSRLMRLQGNRAAQKTYLRRGIAYSGQHADHTPFCQMAGVLGEIHRQEGAVDSMKVYWERALQTAQRARLPEQTARIYSFFAAYYRDQGRWALAHELYERAEESCRNLAGGFLEIRFLLDAMEFHAGLGCWRIIESDLESAQALLDAYRGQEDPHLFGLRSAQVRTMRARWLLAQGEVERAEELYRDIERHGKAFIPPVLWNRLLYHRCEGLIANNQTQRASRLAAEGLRACLEQHIPEHEPLFRLQSARIRLQSGDLAGCRRDLDDFESLASRLEEPYPRQWVQHDVLRVRLALAEHDAEAVARAFTAAASRLEGFVRGGEGSAEGYLFFEVAREVRDVGLEILRDDARAGYVFALLWNGVFRELGADRHSLDSTWPRRALRDCARLVASSLRGEAAAIPNHVVRFLNDIARGGVDHLVYAFAENRAARWWANEETIRRDELTLKRRQLDTLVAHALQALSNSQSSEDSEPDRDLAQDLHDLYVTLLPADLARRAERPRLLLITTDGPLDALPFSALNRSPEGYEPLMSMADIAYLRRLSEDSTSSGAGPGLVFAGPQPAEVLQRRYGQLRELPQALLEGERIHRLQPGSILLTGNQATKAALLSRWQNARFIYLASHVVRHSEAPYITFLPLSPDPRRRSPALLGEALEDMCLDAADIRRADLTRCELVVLSSCASGAPYVEHTVAAPSLGDVFVDAGAHAVVQTLWNVSDDDALRIATAFAEQWAVRGTSPITSLARACRSVWKTAEHLDQPFAWAAYSVVLGAEAVGNHQETPQD